jgi:tetratricopeptide (TPR) repeat protein
MRPAERVLLAALALTAAAASAEPSSKALQESRAIYEEGQRHYRVGDYREAAEAFKRAYTLSGVPGLLFDLGQAQRLLGDCPAARHSYQSYIELDPTGAKVAMARSYLKDLEHCPEPEPPPAAAPATTEPVATTAAAPAPATATAATPAEATSTKTAPSRRLWPLALVGAGALMLGGGAFFAISAKSASDDLTRRFAQPAPWTADAARQESWGRSASQASIGLWIAGAVTLLAGAALLLFLPETS